MTMRPSTRHQTYVTMHFHPAAQSLGSTSQKRDLSWVRPSGKVVAVAKQLQGFGAPALLLDTLELAYGLRSRSNGASPSIDGASESRAQTSASLRSMTRAMKRLLAVRVRVPACWPLPVPSSCLARASVFC